MNRREGITSTMNKSTSLTSLRSFSTSTFHPARPSSSSATHPSSPLHSPSRSASSPILSSSIFSQFDYFLSDISPPSTANNTPCLTHSSSLSSFPSTPGPSDSESSPLRRAKTTYKRPQTFMEVSEMDENDTSIERLEIDLTSPQVLGSPVLGNVAKMPERKSVKVSEMPKVVNWARPLRHAEVVQPSLPIFGVSLQRSRRINRTTSTAASTPSPLSSGDMPHTPPTPESASLASRGWSLPPVSEAKGLGFGSEFEWSDSLTTSSSGSALADYLDSASPCSSTHGSPTPTQSRIISSSDSLVELSSPSTLDELRYLRQAAMDLEAQARGPLAVSHQTASPARSISVRERRIKRKAVPSLDLGDTSSTRSKRSGGVSSSASTPISATSAVQMHTLIPDILPSSESSISSQPKASALPFPQSASCTVAPQPPMAPRPPLTPKKSFYNNILATRSMLEISPRSSSLPVFPKSTSPQTRHQRMISSPSTIASFDTSRSSSESDEGEPITPHGLSDKEEFITQMEASLRALDLSNGSSLNLSRFRNKDKGDKMVDGMKSKKGLSRFFRKNAVEV